MVLCLTTKVVLDWKGAQKGLPRRISQPMMWNRFLKESAFKQKPLERGKLTTQGHLMSAEHNGWEMTSRTLRVEIQTLLSPTGW